MSTPAARSASRLVTLTVMGPPLPKGLLPTMLHKGSGGNADWAQAAPGGAPSVQSGAERLGAAERRRSNLRSTGRPSRAARPKGASPLTNALHWKAFLRKRASQAGLAQIWLPVEPKSERQATNNRLKKAKTRKSRWAGCRQLRRPARPRQGEGGPGRTEPGKEGEEWLRALGAGWAGPLPLAA